MAGYRPEGIDDTYDERTRADGAAPAAAPDRGASVAGRPGRADGPTELPRLGVVGWLRWTWRQLTSMRVALLLLMLLAVAAVPGSVLPQRPQDPARVAEYLADHPELGAWLDRAGAFDVYASAWFSAIYLLLFTSLVGCIVPRTRAHLGALRARPPRTPRRFDRFPARAGWTTAQTPQEVADAARAALRGPTRWLPRFRVDVREEGAGRTVSAERGYLRESGNLAFHLALVGLLISVGTGQFLHYRGQAIVLEGRGFANAVVDYDTFESGSGFDPSSLVPFSLTLDSFVSRFDPATLASRYFRADVTVREPDGTARAESIRVNHPLTAGGAKVYLQGNGYAPDVTVRDAAGGVAFSGPVPFLPEDAVYTSRGVIKVPDVADGPQIGMLGYLLPTADEFLPDQWRSVHPLPQDPLLVLSVWSGDLGLDDGVPQNAYQLDRTGLEQAVDAAGDPVTLYLRPGDTVALPDGLGELTYESTPRFVALDLRHDPTLPFVLVFALVALTGLAVSLFTPRRRIWLRAEPGTDGRTVVSAAGLARGDDVGLQGELDRVVEALVGPDAATDDRPPAPDDDGAPHRQPDRHHDAVTRPEGAR